MDQDLPDDFFTDDLDLDDLPPNTLAQFEQSAFLSTQAKQTTRPKTPDSDYGLEDEDVIDLNAQQTFAGPHRPAIPFPRADEIEERQNWRQNRYAEPAVYPVQQSYNHTIQLAANGIRFGNTQHGQDVSESRPGISSTQSDTIDVSALQQRIVEVSGPH